MKTYYCLITLLLLVSLSGCKPKETTLSGQAFIVTQGGENIKLGLVEVQLIEKDAVKEFIQKKETEIDPKITAIQREIEDATTNYQKTKILFNYDNHLSDTPEYKEMLAKADAFNREIGSQNLYTPVDLAFARLCRATNAVEQFSTTKDYFDSLILPNFQRTLTDADGKFYFSYPQDRNLAIFAKAERLVNGKIEKYFWLVNAPSGIEKAQLFLSNNNLVFTDPDGYFKMKPKPDL